MVVILTPIVLMVAGMPGCLGGGFKLSGQIKTRPIPAEKVTPNGGEK